MTCDRFPMPKEISHILIAKEVLTELKCSEGSELAPLLERHLPSFYLGAIIPDAFFYDMTPLLRVSGNHLWISRALHMKEAAENDKKATGFFEGISVTSPAWETKVAFAAGIVTHTVSDRMVHGVIDYVTESWGEKNGPAMATHRQLETLLDMAFLEPLGLHPRGFPLERFLDMRRSTQNILFAHYLLGLTARSGPQDRSLLGALRRAHGQQLLFLKLFGAKWPCQMVALSNRLAAGRLEPWFRLFYPEEIGTRGFPIMKRLDLDALTDGDRFSGPFASLVATIVAEAIGHIQAGLQRLR
ncbi:MAG: zinc dependent phospholipase C family protein [Thermodesulfobacteriota bacterium]|nr:zinc dependent phospholipase C family protein [Thermodesulfobacteriota bacterium]